MINLDAYNEIISKLDMNISGDDILFDLLKERLHDIGSHLDENERIKFKTVLDFYLENKNNTSNLLNLINYLPEELRKSSNLLVFYKHNMKDMKELKNG